VIESEIPPGWSFMVDELPTVAMSDRLSPFRAAIRQAFSSLPRPEPRRQESVSGSYLGGLFELQLHSPRVSERQAWLAGPSSSGYIAPEQQIEAAIDDKRQQLRGLPYPAILALGGALGASEEDYEIALFGRSFARRCRARVSSDRCLRQGRFRRLSDDRWSPRLHRHGCHNRPRPHPLLAPKSRRSTPYCSSSPRGTYPWLQWAATPKRVYPWGVRSHFCFRRRTVTRRCAPTSDR
jgi:hypothetical protein